METKNMTENIKKSKKGFFEKAKEHKKEIVIGTALVFSVIGTILVVKKSALPSIKSPLVDEAMIKSIEEKNNVIPFASKHIEKNIRFPIDNTINVREHVRNLPDGWNPSINKVKLASKFGYSLEGNQTWVNSYTKVSV